MAEKHQPNEQAVTNKPYEGKSMGKLIASSEEDDPTPCALSGRRTLVPGSSSNMVRDLRLVEDSVSRRLKGSNGNK